MKVTTELIEFLKTFKECDNIDQERIIKGLEIQLDIKWRELVNEK